MFFIIPRDKKTLFFYIFIILLGIILEHFQILSTEKTVGLCMLLAMAIIGIQYLLKNR